VAFTVSTRLWLFGADNQPSGPTSSADRNSVGGDLSRPRMIGDTVLPEESTTILSAEGEDISVWERSSGELLERNSATRPVIETKSPVLTLFRTVEEEEKMNKPLETRSSFTGSPEM